jgi:hypothetical protein
LQQPPSPITVVRPFMFGELVSYLGRSLLLASYQGIEVHNTVLIQLGTLQIVIYSLTGEFTSLLSVFLGESRALFLL